MAIAVIGGLLTSTVLTLVVVPAVFTILDDLERWLAPRASKLLAPPPGSVGGEGGATPPAPGAAAARAPGAGTVR
jgi:hydrophobic/amphiphilic exporter-1 (mainly G- bacteria), HAE1 family